MKMLNFVNKIVLFSINNGCKETLLSFIPPLNKISR